MLSLKKTPAIHKFIDENLNARPYNFIDVLHTYMFIR